MSDPKPYTPGMRELLVRCLPHITSMRNEAAAELVGLIVDCLKDTPLSEREVSELAVQAGAVILATTPLIDAPKLCHNEWMGLSRQILEAANAVA